MAEIQLDLVTKLDRRSAQRASQALSREFTQAGQQAGVDFQRQFERRIQNVDTNTAATQAAREFSTAGTRAGRQFADNAETSLRRGDWNGAAREAARDFTRTFEHQARPEVDVDARSTSADAGTQAGDAFAGGFAGSVGLSALAGRGGAIATAITGGVLAGVKLVGPQIQAAMNLEAATDLTAARLGVDAASMKSIADGAAQAFSSNWGASIEANLDTATSAIQSGLLAPTADTTEVQKMIEQLSSVSTILGEDMPAVSRSAAQAIRTGLVADASEAFDLLVKGQQSGLNVSQDMLDTVDEYATQFRAMGLTGAEAFGLLNQAVKGGARDTDKAADFIKEGIIRMTDGSKTTTEAFESLGLNAEEMATRFAAGGRTTATAFDEVLDKIRAIPDPVEQSRTAVALFGTQAEDMQDAVRNLDLTTAVQEFGKVEGASQRAADTMVRNSLNEWQQAGRNIQTVLNNIRESLNFSEWFSSIPRAINDLLGPKPQLAPGAPGVPATVAPAPGPAVGQPALPTPPTQRNPLDVFAPTRDGMGGPTAADFYGPNARGVDQGILQIAEIARRFGLTMTSGVRNEPGSYHHLGSAGDFGGPIQNMRAFAEFMNANFGSQMKELIFSGPGWSGNLWNGKPHKYSASTLGDHTDHVHAALADNVALQNGAVPVYIAGADTAVTGTYPHGQATAATTGSTSGPSMGSIGTPLDADLGLSNGLAGLADNATRFLGNLGFAPVLGALSGVQQGLGYQPGQAGSGLMGLLAGMGALGPQYLLNPSAAPTTGLPAQPFGPSGPQGPFGPPPGPIGPQQPVGRAPGSGGWQPSGGGFNGLGGLPMAAIQSGIAAAGTAGAPFGGQAAAAAAQTVTQLINRTVAYAGQSAAIGVEGLFETFSLSGSPLGDLQNSWLGRLLAGFAGARPALPTSAGGTEAPVKPDPNATQHGQGQGQPPGPQGPTVHIENFHQDPQRNGQQAAQDLAFNAYSAWSQR
ncbi:phage tail tape measure protein [Mycolicibacterium elephantis]